MRPIYQRDFEPQPTTPTILVPDTPDPVTGRPYYLMPAPPPPRFWVTLASAREDGSGAQLAALEDKVERGVALGSDDFSEYLRLRGREDLYFFAKHCMGFNWLAWDLHAPIAWAWQAPNGWKQPTGQVLRNFRWATIPRGHLKTTLLTQAYATWRIIRSVEERILLYTMGDEFASMVLSPIKMLFEGAGTHGQLFRGLYGDIIPSEAERGKKYDWNQHALTFKRRGNYTDPTIRAKGIGSRVTGGHYTLQLIDDLVGEELNRTQMDKLIRTFDNLTPLYHSIALGERRMVGTPWAFYDPLVYAGKHWKDSMVARLSWEDLNKRMIFDKCDRDEALRLKKRNSWFFSCQYECMPKDEEKIGFQREWFRYFSQTAEHYKLLDKDGQVVKTIARASCNHFIFVDPNTGREPGDKASIKTNQPVTSKRDYMGWIVLAVTPDNEWIVPRAIRWRCNPDQAIEKTYELLDIWKPKFVAIEQIASQYLWKFLFLNEWKRGRAPFILRDFDSGGKSKTESRIKGLIPFYANGRVFHRDSELADVTAGITALENELIDHPNPEFDDLSDALSAAIGLAYAPGSDVPRMLNDIKTEQDFERSIAKLDMGSRLEALYLKRRRAGGETTGDHLLFEGGVE